MAAAIGRNAELEVTTAALASAATGRGSTVLCSGEPGIGKSRLLGEAARLAAERGFQVAWGRAWETGGAPPYVAFREIARALRKKSDAMAAIPDLLLAQHRGLDATSAEDRLLLFETVHDALAAAALEAPLLLLFDDLHVSDPGTLQLLAFLAPRVGALPVLVVGAYRDAEVRANPTIAELLGRCAKSARVLHLARLGADGVEALVRQQVPDADASTIALLRDKTGGNPLFVIELLHVLRASPGKGTEVPDSVRGAIEEHLRAVAEPLRSLLAVGAVVGRTFAATVVAEASDLDAAEVTARLGAAATAGVVHEVQPSVYEFSHVLVRDTLVASVAPARRAELHARVAAALEQAAADRADAPLDAIALHLCEAGPSHATRAVEIARAAAARASRQLAFEHAAELLDRAWALAGGLPAHDRAELAIERGDALLRSGDVEAGHGACRDACALAREIADGALFARAALTYGSVPTFGLRPMDLVDLLEQSLEMTTDDATRARVLARLASAAQPAIEPGEPIRVAREALALSSTLADERVRLETLHYALGAYVDFVDPRERRALGEECVRLAQKLGERSIALRARARLVFDHADLGDFDGALRAADRYEATAREFRQAHVHWPTPLFRAMVARLRGLDAEADALVTEAQARVDASGDPNAQRALATHRLFALRVANRDDEVVRDLPRLEATLGQWQSFEYPAVLRATAYARVGDRARVREALARCDRDRAARCWDTMQGAWLAEAAFVAADREWAEAVRQLFARTAPDEWCSWSMVGFALEGPVARALFLAEATLGRLDAARGLADAALTAIRRSRAAALESRLVREIEMVFGGAAAPSRTVARDAPVAVDLAMVREGDVWALTAFGTTVRARDARGLAMIAELVASPRREVHVLDLAGGGAPGVESVAGDAGEAIDREARDAYRARVAELRSELDEAEAHHDGGRTHRLRAELEAITEELSRSVGKGGRPRRVAGAAERARINVQRRISGALAKIAEVHPRLGAHLEIALRTGTFCSYLPERDPTLAGGR